MCRIVTLSLISTRVSYPQDGNAGFLNICCDLAIVKLKLEDEAIRQDRFIIAFSNFPVEIILPHDVGVNTICCISDSFSGSLYQNRHGGDSHPKSSYIPAQMAHYTSPLCFSERKSPVVEVLAQHLSHELKGSNLSDVCLDWRTCFRFHHLVKTWDNKQQRHRMWKK